MYDKDLLKELYSAILEKRNIIKDYKVLVGFDGYIDKLVHLKKNQNQPPEYFSTIEEFSKHMSDNSFQSSDIEVKCISENLGGNGPLLAEALAAKDVDVTCIGAMGYPELHKGFEKFAKHCDVISIEQPASTFAMEFSDGKLMFGDSESLANIDFATLCERVGFNTLTNLIDTCNIFCFTNWSGLLNSNNLLQGILSKICPNISEKNRVMFFDLADPSPKSDEQISLFFDLLGELRKHFYIVLGLNPKECLVIYNKFFNEAEACLKSDMPERLIKNFPCDEIVLHGLDCATAGTIEMGARTVQGERVANPKVVTGGGDNFNSGYCIGKLMDLTPKLCACLGNLSSMLFVSDGESPDLDRIIDFIRDLSSEN